LTLTDNPHFYIELPTSPDAFEDSLVINPTEDFRLANEFYVLTDKSELAYIMTDRVLQSFSNFWCPNNTIIFKGFVVLFSFPPVSYVLPDICGKLRGGSIVKAPLKGTYCGFCKRLLVSAVPRSPRNPRGLQPIITEDHSRLGWECLIDSFPMHSSPNFDLCVCTGRPASDSPVRCDFIAHWTPSTQPANINIAPSPVATNVRATRVQCGVQNSYPYARRRFTSRNI
jgi:hypothetical protein